MECEDVVISLHAVQASKQFLDVGVNAGAYTVLVWKVVGSLNLAFEPTPKTADLLSDQLEINRTETLVNIKIMISVIVKSHYWLLMIVDDW